MRSMNERAALRLLIADGPMTRVRLGEAAGLSGPTTSQLVKRLSEAGLVVEAGHTTGSRGPNAVIYRACTEAALGVALHVRVDRVVARVVDASDGPFGSAEVAVGRPNHEPWGDVKAAIDAACAVAGCDPSRIVAICVGGPGAVTADGDVLSFAEDMPGWPSHAVRSQLEEQIGVSVLIDNDVKLAAVAESHARGGAQDFALLWQGEGLGVAALAAGEVYRGAAGAAGEIGYLPAPRTAAGFEADAVDLQGLAGSEAMTRLAQRHNPSIASYAEALQALTAGDLREALLNEMAPRTAEALIPVIAVLDPAFVVLSGPTGSAMGEAGADLVQNYLRQHTRWATPVVATTSSSDPVLRGASLTLSSHLADRLVGRLE